MNSVGFLGISVFLNSSFSLLDVILNAVNLLLKEKCSQNQIITFVFLRFFYLSARCDRGNSYTAILCINEPIPVIILQEV